MKDEKNNTADIPQCALCGSTLQAGEQIFRCPECQTFYHAECWQLCGNKCAVLGCVGAGEPAYSSRKPSFFESPTSNIINIDPRELHQLINRISLAL